MSISHNLNASYRLIPVSTVHPITGVTSPAQNWLIYTLTGAVQTTAAAGADDNSLDIADFPYARHAWIQARGNDVSIAFGVNPAAANFLLANGETMRIENQPDAIGKLRFIGASAAGTLVIQLFE